jgi:quinol monooxygenase YgiN
VPTIDRRTLCTVIVTVDAPDDAMSELEAHARVGIARFTEYDGFVSGALHRSDDGGRLVQYLQWRDEAAYRACIDDTAWDELESTRRFMQLARDGTTTVDARTYDVVAISSE